MDEEVLGSKLVDDPELPCALGICTCKAIEDVNFLACKVVDHLFPDCLEY